MRTEREHPTALDADRDGRVMTQLTTLNLFFQKIGREHFRGTQSIFVKVGPCKSEYGRVCICMADGSEGRCMRRVKGARHAHAVMRAQGRTSGDEGRAVIAWNREAQRREAEEGRAGDADKRTRTESEVLQ